MPSLPAVVPTTMADGDTIFASIDDVQATAINAIIAFLAAAPAGSGTANGVAIDLLLEPAALDTAFAAKHVAGGSWGLPGTVYGADQFVVLLSDSDRVASYVGGNGGGVITAVSNTTPIQITVGAGHSYLTGDTASVKGTGVAAIDLGWFKLTKISSTVVSLDGTVASGAAALTASSVLYGDPNPILFRVDSGGNVGLGAMHIAPGLRGFAGQSVGLGGIGLVWLQPHVDSPGVTLMNTDAVSNPQALVYSKYIQAIDVHSAVSRTIWQLDVDGTQIIKRQSGRADTDKLFRIRNDADSDDEFSIRADGGVHITAYSAIGPGAPTAGAELVIQASAVGQVPLAVLQIAGQTGDLFEASSNVGTVFSRFNKAGYFMTRKAITLGGSPVPALADMVAGESAIGTNANGDLVWVSRVGGALQSITINIDTGAIAVA